MINNSTVEALHQKYNIETSPEILKKYEINNPLVRNDGKSRCSIKPKDVPELQNLIRHARDEKFALVPVSSGDPHRKGGTACVTDHAIVDLSGWKKIPWINRRNRVCFVEPGVTYGELNAVLIDHGMTLPTPLAPRNTKSVLASTIAREPRGCSGICRTPWHVPSLFTAQASFSEVDLPAVRDRWKTSVSQRALRKCLWVLGRPIFSGC